MPQGARQKFHIFRASFDGWKCSKIEKNLKGCSLILFPNVLSRSKSRKRQSLYISYAHIPFVHMYMKNTDGFLFVILCLFTSTHEYWTWKKCNCYYKFLSYQWPAVSPVLKLTKGTSEVQIQDLTQTFFTSCSSQIHLVLTISTISWAVTALEYSLFPGKNVGNLEVPCVTV